jgi:hypothetical protein
MNIVPFDHDVLCGRGKHCYYHAGNQTFRNLVAENLAYYTLALTKKLKMQIVITIVDTVIACGGRFLMQDSQGYWKNGGKALGKKKAGNTLRDAQRGRISLTTDTYFHENSDSLAVIPNSQAKIDKNTFIFNQLENLLVRSRTNIRFSNEKMHQHFDGDLESLVEGNLERESISKLCVGGSMTLEPTIDWNRGTMVNDRMNDYLDDCIVNELSWLLKSPSSKTVKLNNKILPA